MSPRPGTEGPDSSRAKATLLARRRLLGSRFHGHAANVASAPAPRDDESEYMPRAVEYELSELEREEIVEIDRALSRIDRGRWGLCEACGEAIDPDRLVAFPEARACLRCAVRREHHPS